MATSPPRRCPGCGRVLGGECSGCLPAFDPPRFCSACGRRLTVQVTTTRWTAHCRRCGTTIASS